MKKRFLLALTVLYCMSPLLRADKDSAFLTEPYLQNPLQNGVSIMWHTKEPAYGWVEYGTNEQFGSKADLVIDGIRNANTTLHKVRLTDLDPESTYYYRACFKPILKFEPYEKELGEVVYSKTYTYKSIATNRPVSCVIFNDIHQNWKLAERLLLALGKRDYQFSIFNGDCFQDPGTKERAISALAAYNSGVSAHSRPALYIRGNHETRGAFAKDWKTLFDFPNDSFFFSLTAGPVHFIFLDCGESTADDHPRIAGLNSFEGYREAQQAWLKQEVKSAAFLNAKYRVLVHHIPLYNYADNAGTSEPCRTLWSPILDSVPIDLAISGHTHNYHSVPVNAAGNKYLVLIGGGPAPPKKNRPGVVMVLSANDEQLNVEVLNEAGATIGNYQILAKKELKVVD